MENEEKKGKQFVTLKVQDPKTIKSITMNLGETYIHPGIDKETFIDCLSKLVSEYCVVVSEFKKCVDVLVELNCRRGTIDFDIDEREEFDIDKDKFPNKVYHIILQEDAEVKKMHCHVKISYIRYREVED